jgi:hypothetical protein
MLLSLETSPPTISFLHESTLHRILEQGIGQATYIYTRQNFHLIPNINKWYLKLRYIAVSVKIVLENSFQVLRYLFLQRSKLGFSVIMTLATAWMF